MHILPQKMTFPLTKGRWAQTHSVKQPFANQDRGPPGPKTRHNITVGLTGARLSWARLVQKEYKVAKPETSVTICCAHFALCARESHNCPQGFTVLYQLLRGRGSGINKFRLPVVRLSATGSGCAAHALAAHACQSSGPRWHGPWPVLRARPGLNSCVDVDRGWLDGSAERRLDASDALTGVWPRTRLLRPGDSDSPSWTRFGLMDALKRTSQN